MNTNRVILKLTEHDAYVLSSICNVLKRFTATAQDDIKVIATPDAEDFDNIFILQRLVAKISPDMIDMASEVCEQTHQYFYKEV